MEKILLLLCYSVNLKISRHIWRIQHKNVLESGRYEVHTIYIQFELCWISKAHSLGKREYMQNNRESRVSIVSWKVWYVGERLLLLTVADVNRGMNFLVKYKLSDIIHVRAPGRTLRTSCHKFSGTLGARFSFHHPDYQLDHNS